MKKLSLKQLRTLGKMAHAVHKLVGCGMPFDEWRRACTSAVTGRDSWKELVQSDYIPLLNAFRRSLGMPPAPDRTPKDKHASLLWTLADRVQHWGLSPAYVAAIAADKFNRPELASERRLDAICAGLTDTEMHQLLYTVQRAARRSVARTAEKYNLPPACEIHTSPSTMPPPRLAEYRGDMLAAPPRKPRRPSAKRPKAPQ